jgi:hypothetical protein
VVAELTARKKLAKTLLAGANNATPLIAAVLTGNTAAAAARLAAGDDIDWCAGASEPCPAAPQLLTPRVFAPPCSRSTDRFRRTPLILASFLGNIGLVELLLANNASRSSEAKVRELRLAACGWHVLQQSRSSVLHEAGLMPSCVLPACVNRYRIKNGNTALDAAFKSGNDEVIFALMTLTDAVKREDQSDVKQSDVKRILARPDVDVDKCVNHARARPRVRCSGICFVCRPALPFARLRLPRIARRHDAMGKTALMHAAERGLRDLVGLLLENGADVQLEDAVRMCCCIVVVMSRLPFDASKHTSHA